MTSGRPCLTLEFNLIFLMREFLLDCSGDLEKVEPLESRLPRPMSIVLEFKSFLLLLILGGFDEFSFESFDLVCLFMLVGLLSGIVLGFFACILELESLIQI